MSDPLPTAQITITRLIGDDGRMSVLVAHTPRDSSVTELLGMLEVAKSQIFHDIEVRRNRDC